LTRRSVLQANTIGVTASCGAGKSTSDSSAPAPKVLIKQKGKKVAYSDSHANQLLKCGN